MINNGYDLLLYKSNHMEKVLFRMKFNIKKKIPIIGNIARFAPMKDHVNLLQSLSILKQKNINFFCLLAGSNIDKNNSELRQHLKKLIYLIV